MVRRAALEQVGPFDAARFPWSGGPAEWTVRSWKAGWRYRVVNRRNRILVHHQHRSILDQAPGERAPEATFRMPVRFEDLLREAGIEPRYPSLLRRAAERVWKGARNWRRFYAAPPGAASTAY
jgi:GT2 family glycosyltransferase